MCPNSLKFKCLGRKTLGITPYPIIPITMIGQFIRENVEKAKFLTASVTITLKNIKVTKNSEPVNNKTRYEVRHRPAEGTVTHCFDYSISVAAVFFSRASCKFV